MRGYAVPKVYRSFEEFERDELRKLDKLQVIGHTPLKSGKPEYDSRSHSWNIDTGAYLGRSLSALRLTPEGTVLESISIPTFTADID